MALLTTKWGCLVTDGQGFHKLLAYKCPPVGVGSAIERNKGIFKRITNVWHQY